MFTSGTRADGREQYTDKVSSALAGINQVWTGKAAQVAANGFYSSLRGGLEAAIDAAFRNVYIWQNDRLPERNRGVHFAHASPQKAEQVAVPIVNLKKLIQDRLGYSDCAAYIAKLINKAAELSEGKNDAISTDIMTLYKLVNRQARGGFFLNQKVLWQGKPVSGTVSGNLLEGTGKVMLASKSGYRDNPLSISRLPSDNGIAAIHEIIHLAGKNTYYGEELLSKAAQALEPDRISEGTWWEWGLRNHCLPPELRGRDR